jgi:hypothetical protein
MKNIDGINYRIIVAYQTSRAANPSSRQSSCPTLHATTLSHETASAAEPAPRRDATPTRSYGNMSAKKPIHVMTSRVGGIHRCLLLTVAARSFSVTKKDIRSNFGIAAEDRVSGPHAAATA